MNDLLYNLQSVTTRIQEAAVASGRAPDAVQLVAVTKTVEAARVQAAIAAGVRTVGENRVQELRQKRDVGAYEGASLHLIGHLQRNKVADVVGVVSLIQSVDSLPLIEEIARVAARRNIVQDILLEVNIANEPTKHGFLREYLPEALKTTFSEPHLRVRGLMCIPPPAVLGDNRRHFEAMHQLFIDMQAQIIDNTHMEILSMGMSDDYDTAIRFGSTMVRVGSAIFGARG